jgi:hypothetical protein
MDGIVTKKKNIFNLHTKLGKLVIAVDKAPATLEAVIPFFISSNISLGLKSENFISLTNTSANKRSIFIGESQP